MSVHRVRREEQAEDWSHPKGVEVLLRQAARKVSSDPENVDNPMITPHDNEVRQSGRFLVLQKRDLWIRPADLSWQFPIPVTFREMLFRKYRGRSSDELKAKEDKIEEANKQKTLNNRNEEWDSTRWKQSWTWTTSSSSSYSAWRD